jgi:hypothetical protein
VTLLYDAAYYNRPEAAKLLLAYHADVNASDGLGYTPLHEAGVSLAVDIVRMLLDHGANVNARARNGDTPLMELRWERFWGRGSRRGFDRQASIEIEQLLLQHGAR